ncbi:MULTISPECIES: phosphatidylserine decarboxylase [unclassified Campylobacter]|uniref:phosphatidylserine decarboxylase n=1 Tax=unclassified Campylobacter TaxID=2593542 RepID=UPI0012383CF4|nr:MULTISPECIES: phosphatidylserine decarboxylase [unclassified Campylobacter]KAA6225479.1 phosphatidylserine decarboxylase [Campylobacter sp. LR196d]KAA6227417.1 phosphatidylserine decarboxylase [Campylobacter sp. LR185c]KAA6229750.1 phosphatidylserine decarboxylase [Campylobacter sp. LR286c]KAA6234493.1 phosphatidylserine decarboxylase [Campylobacter sp. LR264d]KAA8604115.1 phosphatidylserine decarboxylase [Campylobacter sp. LR185c]
MKAFIAKEGYISLAVVLILLLLCWIFYSFSFLLAFLFIVFLILFRTPSINLACVDKKAILVPIDGRVVTLNTSFCDDLGECIELSIKNALYDRGSLYSPCNMYIKNISIKHGLNLCSNFKLADKLNERIHILAKSNDYKIGFLIRANALDRRLKLDNISDTLLSGQRLSFLLNANVSLFLPLNTRLYIGLGDEIKAGSLLGYFE